MKAKPWQILVIVAGLLIAMALTAWNLMGSKDDLPQTYLLIDVGSGQIYRVNKNRHRLSLPAPHPKSKKRALIGVEKDERGYFVSEYDLGALRGIDESVKNTAVDANTGELLVPAKDPIAYDPD